MKYNNDLIPEKYKPKIDIDQYLGNERQIKKQKSNLTPLFYIIAGIFGILFLSNVFTRFFAGIFFLAIGLVMLPSIHKGIENTFKFSFNWKIKTGFIVLLLIPAFLFTSSYQVQEKKIAEQERVAEEIRINKEKAEQAEKERLEKQRKDSLNYYTHIADSLKTKRKYQTAFKNYEKAKQFADYNSNFDFKQGQCLSAMRKYDDAILYFSKLGSSDALYERAICYKKKGNIQDAVNDLKKAIKLGNKDAEKFHDKINPIRKRITGYVTLCCDGTTSNARGRGACSRHGGVCDWNHPVYQEYRKY